MTNLEPTHEDKEAEHAYFSVPGFPNTEKLLDIARQLDLNQDATKEAVELAARRQKLAVTELRDLVSEMFSVCRAIDTTLDELYPRVPLPIYAVDEPAPF